MVGLVPLHAQSYLGSRGLSYACWASAISPLSLLMPLLWVRLHGEYFWALKISISLKLLCYIVSFLSRCLSSSHVHRNHLYDLWTCVKVGIAILVGLEWGLRFYISIPFPRPTHWSSDHTRTTAFIFPVGHKLVQLVKDHTRKVRDSNLISISEVTLFCGCRVNLQLQLVIVGLCHTLTAVSYTHLTLPTKTHQCRSRWSPYH